jgi:4-amino-4-deoxy-L-arabinose transferase-like glycosyltransferase
MPVLKTSNRLPYLKIIIFLFVLLFTFILRAHDYEREPTSNHLDEQLYAWSGIYLIETGIPVSWSTLDYPKSAEVYRGDINYKGGLPRASVTLYKPWLDEPPLFSVLVGYFAHLYGANRNQFIPSTYIRIPLIFIAALVSVFVFLIAQKLFGYKTGILAMLIYGVTPIFVFGSRSAMPENLIALCYVVSMWLLLKYREKLKFWPLIPIPILAGVAGLSKPTGYLLVLFALFVTVWFSVKKIPVKTLIKYSAYLIIGVLPFIAFYFWYGNHFDPAIFKTIFAIQSGRPVGFSSFAWFLISPSYATFTMKDGWYLFSVVYALYLLIKPHKDMNLKFISLAFIFWVLVVMFTGGEGDPLPWYRFPVFPVLSIISALGIKHLLKVNNLFSTFIFFGLLLTGRYLLSTPFNPNVRPLDYKIWLVILLIPGLLSFIFKSRFIKSLNKLVAVGIIIVGIFFNTCLIYRYYDLVCEALTCPMVPTTKLSELRFPFVWRYLVFTFSR